MGLRNTFSDACVCVAALSSVSSAAESSATCGMGVGCHEMPRISSNPRAVRQVQVQKHRLLSIPLTPCAANSVSAHHRKTRRHEQPAQRTSGQA